MEQRTGLYRSNVGKMLGGVACGIARSLKTDPTLIRIAFILLALLGGGGVFIYIILWIVLPVDDDFVTNVNYEDIMEEKKTNDTWGNPQSKQPNQFKKKDEGSLIAGLVLISLGVIFLVIRYFPRIDFGDLWPVILIVIGIVLLRNAFVSRKQ